jgi:hypothetical protein
MPSRSRKFLKFLTLLFSIPTAGTKLRLRNVLSVRVSSNQYICFDLPLRA